MKRILDLTKIGDEPLVPADYNGQPNPEFSSSKRLSELVGVECAVGKDVESNRVIIIVKGYEGRFSIGENQWLKWNQERPVKGDPFERLAAKIKQHLRTATKAKTPQIRR